MKFTISQTVLRDLIVSAKPFISPRGALPVLANYLVGVSQQTLSLYATDLEMSLTTGVQLMDAVDGRTTIPAASLVEIVGKLPGGDVTIDTDDENQTTIRAGRSRFVLRGLPAAAYPTPLAPGATPALELDARLLSDLLTKTLYAVARDASNPVVTGWWIDLKDGRLTVAAADGFRLSWWVKPFESTGADFTAIIPGRTMAEVLRLVKAADGLVRIHQDDSHIGFEMAGTYVTTRLIAGMYPNFMAMVPPTFKEEVVVGREALMAAIDRVSVMANKQEASILTLSFTPEDIHITASRQELGGGEDWVACRGVKEPFTLMSKGAYLEEAMRVIDGPEVVLCNNGPTQPIVIKSPSADDPLLGLIMPFSLPGKA